MLTVLAEITASGFDLEAAQQFIEIIKLFLSLFTVYPINIFLIAGIALVGFKVFKGAKSSAKG